MEGDGPAPAKQRHTAKQIFELLRDEHCCGGGLTVVKDRAKQVPAVDVHSTSLPAELRRTRASAFPSPTRGHSIKG
ncbi:hypothetical protein GTW10_08195 [Aurantimonas endophytica]|nr:hypothetical protein [Aurantimonas endophytica]